MDWGLYPMFKSNVRVLDDSAMKGTKMQLLNHKIRFQIFINMFSFLMISGPYQNLMALQISVPHNETDKVDRGGLDKMTLVEVSYRFFPQDFKVCILT